MPDSRNAFRPGPTGSFADGKPHPSDEGGLLLAVLADPEYNTVTIDFGTPLSWFAMTTDQAFGISGAILAAGLELNGVEANPAMPLTDLAAMVTEFLKTRTPQDGEPPPPPTVPRPALRHARLAGCPCLNYAFSSGVEYACLLTYGHHPMCPSLMGYEPKQERLIDGLLGVIRRLDDEVIRHGGNVGRIHREAILKPETALPKIDVTTTMPENFERLLDDDTAEDINGSH